MGQDVALVPYWIRIVPLIGHSVVEKRKAIDIRRLSRVLISRQQHHHSPILPKVLLLFHHTQAQALAAAERVATPGGA